MIIIKNTRKLLVLLLTVSVLGLYFQPIAAASNASSSTTVRGYYCTYAISVTNKKASASLTASKNSGALANPLTAKITGKAVTLRYPWGEPYEIKKTQFDNGEYISCNAGRTSNRNDMWFTYADYFLNSSSVPFGHLEAECEIP